MWLIHSAITCIFCVLKSFTRPGQPGVDRAHNGPIRLERDGSVSQQLTSGRVQVYILRHWAYICDDSSFGITEANVICHQLGYTGAISQSNAKHEGYVNRFMKTITLLEKQK